MNKNSKALVILTPAFPGNESEDTWVVSQQLFVKAVKKNFPKLDVIVLSFFYPSHELPYSWNDISVTPFNGMKKRKLRRLILWQQIWKKLNFIRKEQTIIGLFSFWCGECALIGRYFGKWHRLRHFCWICGQDAKEENKWVRFIRPSADELVAMSPFLANEFFKNHRVRPYHIIPNAIDPEMFPSALPPEKDIDILGAGSFEIPKQYHVFTEVIASLQQIFPAIKSYHVGMGPQKENVEALIKHLQVEDNLSLLGVKSHAEVLKLMQRSKIFLHPSLYEGLSTVCLEALYAGAHVISFCYPLDVPVQHWHVVENVEQITGMIEKILKNYRTDNQPVLLYSMDESAKAVMKLFE